MTEEDIVEFVISLPGVDLLTASAANGAPEMAWGDHFFYYDPARELPADGRLPFATIVGGDYPGFDTASQLDRDGVFRVNVAVGRHVFQELFGHSPAAHAEHHSEYDYAALDRIVPHPVYATQGWASVLNPGEETTERLRSLLVGAHTRAAAQFRGPRSE